MTMDLATLYNNFIMYVFGDPVIAGLAFMIVMIMIGVRYNFGAEMYIIVLSPTIAIMLYGILPAGTDAILLIVMGLIIGIAGISLLRR